MTDILMIGAGNVAWQLGKALKQAGHTFAGVYSRTQANAAELATELQCPMQISADLSHTEAQVCLLCVPDSAIASVASQLRLPPNALIAHTSGSQPLLACANTGVFYPLQTVSKQQHVEFSNIPIFIEASDKTAEGILLEMAKSISKRVQVLSSEQRLRLHLSAVFACNFVNHQLAIADALLRKQGLDISFLSHLVEETIEKAWRMPPQQAQTGPAIRHDQSTLGKHLDLLAPHPEWKAVYEAVTKSIQAFGK